MKYIKVYGSSLYEQYDTERNMLLRKNLEEALIHFLSLFYNLVRKKEEGGYGGYGSITIGTAGKRRVEIHGLGLKSEDTHEVSIHFYGFTNDAPGIDFLRSYFHKSAEVEKIRFMQGGMIFLDTRVRHVEQLTKDLSMFQHTNVQYYLDQKKFGL